MNSKLTHGVVLVLFFFSGMTALVLEVVWMRQLTLIFGSTLYAISTILAVFMAGLALGSFIFGRVVDRSNNPLRLYSFLEGGIGIYVLLTPFIFAAVSSIQIFFAQNFFVDFTGLSVIRLVLSFLALIIPTTLMGGTLPVLSKLFVQSKDSIGKKVGLLYAINTFGGVVGTILVGYVLLSLVGVLGTLYVASITSVIISIIAFLLSVKATQNKDISKIASLKSTFKIDPLIFAVLIAFGLSGFAALSLEVLWSRVLVMILGSSIYSFTIILATFLFGIALGSLVMSKLIDRIKNPVSLFVSIELAIGVSIIFMTLLFSYLPIFFLKTFSFTEGVFLSMQVAQFILVALVMIIPTILMGMAFPLVARICTGELKKVGSFIGNVYFVNTLGSMFGPVIAGFVFIPFFGLQTSIFIVASVYIAIALYFLILHIHIYKYFKISVVLLAVIVVTGSFFMPVWDKNILNTGVYRYANFYIEQDLNLDAFGHEIIYYNEGLSSTVAIEKSKDNDLFLTIDGKGDAGTGNDMDTELILGHLPMLLHSDPKDVLVIGLGSGITLGAIEQHDELESVDLVEIEPAVVEAASYFKDFNNNALRDSRVNVVQADGRNFVLTTKKKYDVISAEPSNPWITGNSNLFTKEQFQLYKKRLKKGGIMFQWAHVYALRPEDVKTIVATFQEVFPHTVVWQNFSGRDIFLIGSDDTLQINFERLVEKMNNEKIKKDLSRVNLENPMILLSYSVLNEDGAKEFSKGAKIHTDNHPVLETNAPKGIFLDPSSTESINLETLEKNRTNIFTLLEDISDKTVEKEIAVHALSRTYIMRGEIAFSRAVFFKQVAGEYEKALSIVPENITARETLANIYFEAGSTYFLNQQYEEAKEAFFDVIRLSSDEPEPYLKLAKTYLKQSNGEGAIWAYENARKIDSLDLQTRQELGVLYARKGEYGKAEEEFLFIITYEEDNYFAHNNLANVYRIKGKIKESVVEYEKSLSINGNQPEIVSLLSALELK